MAESPNRAVENEKTNNFPLSPEIQSPHINIVANNLPHPIENNDLELSFEMSDPEPEPQPRIDGNPFLQISGFPDENGNVEPHAELAPQIPPQSNLANLPH